MSFPSTIFGRKPAGCCPRIELRENMGRRPPSLSAVSAVTGSTFATPRTPSVPNIFFASATGFCARSFCRSRSSAIRKRELCASEATAPQGPPCSEPPSEISTGLGNRPMRLLAATVVQFAASLATFISLILRCKVRRLMPSFFAAAVMFPFVVASACMMSRFSVSCRSSGLAFSPNASDAA